MNGKRLSEIAMRIYFAGGEPLLRIWYSDLNKDEQKAFDDYIQEIVGSLSYYYDPANPTVKVMSPQLATFWTSIQMMFPQECTLDYHRYLANRLYIRRCPDCGLYIVGPTRKRKVAFRL
jgi:hypothetical protein